MRIFVPAASALLTDHTGHGEGLITWNILSRLAARGHEIVACARRVALETSPMFDVIQTGSASPFESIEPLAYAARMTRELNRHGGARGFDAALWLMPQGRANLVWAAPRGLPTVIGPLAPGWPGGPRRRRRTGDHVRTMLSPTISALHHRAMARATTVLLSSPAAAGAVHPIVPANRLKVVPFGIEEARFTPQPLRGPPTVVFVGRLEGLKGIGELVEAYPRVRSRIPECRLIVVGDGPERGRVEHLVGQTGGSVEFLGSVPNLEVPALLARASVFCLPSHGEPFGMAILEAMAAGRAVVATDAGGPRFLVQQGKGGVLVAPGDVGALVEALVTLLSDPGTLRAMGQYNRARVEDAFTWDGCVDAIEASLEEAAT